MMLAVVILVTLAGGFLWRNQFEQWQSTA